jgi:hypothetical protein
MSNYEALQNEIANTAENLIGIDGLGFGHEGTVKHAARIIQKLSEADVRALRRVLQQLAEAADMWEAKGAKGE